MKKWTVCLILFSFLILISLKMEASCCERSLVDWIVKKSGDKLHPTQSKKIIDLVYKNCEHPEMTLAIIGEESGFHRTAKSKKGAYGLGQVHYSSWKKQLKKYNINKPEDLFCEHKNILATNYVLCILHKEANGNWNIVLRKYLGKHSKSYNNRVYRNYIEIKKLKK